MRNSGSKTMKTVCVASFEFVKDDSGLSESRTQEVKILLSQIIESSHKRGRPSKLDQEVDNAA